MYAVVSFSRSLFFGGRLLDGIASAIIGVLLKGVQWFLWKTCPNDFFTIILCSRVRRRYGPWTDPTGLGVSPAMISLGNIMSLIPGIKLTNAIRDMIRGDTITGLLCFAEAVIVSMAIAWGLCRHYVLGRTGMRWIIIQLITAFTSSLWVCDYL